MIRRVLLLAALLSGPLVALADDRTPLAELDATEWRPPPYPRKWETDLTSLMAQAERGDAAAQCNLALHYVYGVATKQDLAKAAAWLTKSADHGFLPAQYTLGILYKTGQGVELSHAKADSWFQRAADQGYAPAEHEAALIADRKGQRRLAEALLSVAAGKGFPASQYLLGCVLTDPVERFMWLSLAAPDVESARPRVAVLRLQLTDAQVAAAEKRIRQFHAELAKRRAAKR